MKSVNILGLSIHVTSVETTLKDMKIYYSTKKPVMVVMTVSSVKNVMKSSLRSLAFKDTLVDLFIKMVAVNFHVMCVKRTFAPKENC